MNSTAISAAKAYLAAQQVQAGQPPQEATQAAGASFGSALSNAVNATVETSKAAELQTQALARGDGNMVNVVTAVAETEVAMQAMVTVRDRVISAYQEIMNMPI